MYRQKKKSNSKYGNVKIEAGGFKFDSIRECNRYYDLLTLIKAGEIKELELQKSFILIDTVHTTERTLQQCSYKTDFFYYDNKRQEYIAEDVKGFKTDVYKIKMKLFIERYGKQVTFFENGAEQHYYSKK
jgi:hypothetical protein